MVDSEIPLNEDEVGFVGKLKEATAQIQEEKKTTGSGERKAEITTGLSKLAAALAKSKVPSGTETPAAPPANASQTTKQ